MRLGLLTITTCSHRPQLRCRTIHIIRKRLPQNMDLEYTAERAAELRENFESVQGEIDKAHASSSHSTKARLVAISKVKPASDIKALYDSGHRHFGENYIQEMVDKAKVLPDDIEWHFVGALQSNKAKLAAAVPNLSVLETLSSIKVADILQRDLPSSQVLGVYLQVNTSGEDSKSGLSPPPWHDSSDLVDLAVHVIQKCPNLKWRGLMTIGSWEASHDPSKPNPDFTCLSETRRELVRVLRERGLEISQEEDLELSMGMSADFAQAVKEGSSSVRVGTRIFGERPKKS